MQSSPGSYKSAAANTHLTARDLAEIKRISEKKSIRRVSRAIRQDLDNETLSRMISAYLVLKADGHSDKEFINYLGTKELGRTLSLGFRTAKSVLPPLLLDGEFRSLVMKTRKNISKGKKKEEAIDAEVTTETRVKLNHVPEVIINEGAK